MCKMTAKFPNGYSFEISEEQAKKIRFIQECIRKTREKKEQ